MVETVISRFSKKYFRDNIFHDYLEMANDPVPNIRLRFVSILPLVHKMLRMPQDTPLLQKIADVTEPLLTRDLDSDVVETTGEVFAELGLFGFRAGGLPISSGRKYQNLKRLSGDSITDIYLTQHIPPPDDSLDKQKEEEEHVILVKEWSSEDHRRKSNYYSVIVLVEKGRSSLKTNSKEPFKKTDKKKNVPVEIGSSKKISPTTSTTKIAVKSGKGTLHTMQLEKSNEQSAPGSPVISKTWKASANYKIGTAPNSISSPRNSTGMMTDDYKPLGRLSGSLKSTGKTTSSSTGESLKPRGRAASLKGAK